MISIDNLYIRDNKICNICKKFVKRFDASRDHIIPRSLGGSDNSSNIALTHKKCNNQKGNGLTFQDEIRKAGNMCDWTCSLCKCNLNDDWKIVAFINKRSALVHRKCRENEHRKIYANTKIRI